MDINSIIETLCEKFGIAWGEATKLVPEIIVWGRVKSAIGIAVTALVLLTCVLVLRKCLIACRTRRTKVDGTNGLLYYMDVGGPDLSQAVVISACIGAFTVFIAICALSDWLQWFFAPNMAVIHYIMDLI